MAKTSLDAIDRRILAILQTDGRLSNQEVAERVNLSPSQCLRRIRRLEEAGVIRDYVALLDADKLGLGLLAYVNVRLEKRSLSQGQNYSPDRRERYVTDGLAESHASSFSAAIAGWPEVVACHAMTGEMDYLLRVHVEDMEHFSRFVQDQLLHHPSVIDVKTSFSLKCIKETTALPLLAL